MPHREQAPEGSIPPADGPGQGRYPTAGDRDFEIRALGGNVCSESGLGPQVVNAFDLGLSCGVRGWFTVPVDETTARYDVNQDGLINAQDLSAIRLLYFTHTAP